MWINAQTQARYNAHSEIRQSFPSVSMPSVLSDSILSSHGVYAVQFMPRPEANPTTQRVVELPPIEIDGQWTQQWEVYPLPAEEVAANTEALRDSIKMQATALRRQRETGGITLPGGIQIATGTEDQNRITTVIANAQLAGVTTVDFKAASGWVTLTLAEVQGIAAAIAMHVQACFSAERAHHEAIDVLETLQEVQNYDITLGW